MSDWISVAERLPKPHRSKRKPCPAVIVYYAKGTVAGNLIRLSVSNVEYLRRYPEKFTHWMPIPDPPEAEKSLDASLLGRKGGKARAKKLTKAERVEIARKGGLASQKKRRGKE